MKFTRFILFFLAAGLFSCDKKETKTERDTVLQGEVTIVVDESIYPIIEDNKVIFETDYKANINLVPMPQSQWSRLLVGDSIKLFVLPRNLTETELAFHVGNKAKPKITEFAKDALVFISSKQRKDTVVDYAQVLRKMQGEQVASISELVFDNPGSNAVQVLSSKAQVQSIAAKGLLAKESTSDVIAYIAQHPDAVGVVGLNWLTQPSKDLVPVLENIQVLAVQFDENKPAVKPNQTTLAEEKYLLARELHIVNLQEYDGLGIGFASFLAGDRGQRIVLKSGLLPWKIPPRQIVTRTTLEKEKN